MSSKERNEETFFEKFWSVLDNFEKMFVTCIIMFVTTTPYHATRVVRVSKH